MRTTGPIMLKVEKFRKSSEKVPGQTFQKVLRKVLSEFCAGKVRSAFFVRCFLASFGEFHRSPSHLTAHYQQFVPQAWFRL